MEREIFAAAAEKVRMFGIALLDIRFKRINYNASVRSKIYDRIISERRQIAEASCRKGTAGTAMATDTAFGKGCLTSPGARISGSLGVFMLSLAIVDDFGAIPVLAIAYGGHIDRLTIALALTDFTAVRAMAALGVRKFIGAIERVLGARSVCRAYEFSRNRRTVIECNLIERRLMKGK